MRMSMTATLRRVIPAALVALVVAGCSTVPFKATPLTATSPATAADLVGGLWDQRAGALLVRHSALFELRGMRMPVNGLLKLDPGAGTARLVGMNDMGVKLFDISLDQHGEQANFMLPELARYPQFAAAVATSVRRIFLAPRPAPGDRLTVESEEYVLDSGRDGRECRFIFGGKARQLLEKSCRGTDEWRVRYFEHHQGSPPYPRGIVLEDERGGYRLTLWIESVEPANE